MNEIRWYKGKYCVEVLKKSKGNWLVKALESVPIGKRGALSQEGWKFTTVPRLLWRKPRQ